MPIYLDPEYGYIGPEYDNIGGVGYGDGVGEGYGDGFSAGDGYGDGDYTGYVIDELGADADTLTLLEMLAYAY